MLSENEVDISVLRENAFQLISSGYWDRFTFMINHRIETLRNKLFNLEYNEAKDRERLTVMVQLQELERFVKTLESYASEYIELQKS